METMQIKPTTQLSRKQIIGLFLAKFPANQPLNQMFIEPKVLRVFLPIWLKTEPTEVRDTASGNGFLLLCPQCGKNNKLFYSYDGRMFLCLNYRQCGWKCHTLAKLKKTSQKRTRQISVASEVYVDYALHQKVGIYSDNPRMRISYLPGAKIYYQIEGEALAIKAGIWHWIRNKQADNNHLIIYTDNKTLLHSFHSNTQAGEWWKQAYQIARENKVHLVLKFVASKNNPADQLTRDARAMARQKARREHFYQGNDGLATNETSWGNANRLLGANSAKANMNLQKIPGDYNAKKSKHAQ